MSKTLIVVHSYHHGNTAKVAAAISDVLGAEVKNALDVNPGELENYDLVGFGSGINAGSHYPPLLELAKALPDTPGRKAFIFSTSGTHTDEKLEKYHRSLRKTLLSRGYAVTGEFGCKGYITFGPFKLFGGKSKGHPDESDLKAAEDFAKNLLR